MTWFDETRLEDAHALSGIDPRLRHLAESGARVRRDSGEVARLLAESDERAEAPPRPRAVVAAGADSRLLRSVLEPSCPVPLVAWPGHGLPGWAGPLDLVVVLAPDGSDVASAGSAAEACRRGCEVVVAAPPDSLVAAHLTGRSTTLLACSTLDQLACAVVTLDFLHGLGLGPAAEPDPVAEALDDVARACSPHRDLTVNPAKLVAIALAEATPLLWGGSPIAARAARRVAEALRRGTGRAALAGEVDMLEPVLTAARPRDLFEDPLAGDAGEAALRPALVVLDDQSPEPLASAERARLGELAERHGVRVETISAQAESEVARYASLVLSGTYAAEYLAHALVD